jgi:hypothetical protein
MVKNLLGRGAIFNLSVENFYVKNRKVMGAISSGG